MIIHLHPIFGRVQVWVGLPEKSDNPNLTDAQNPDLNVFKQTCSSSHFSMTKQLTTDFIQ